MDNNRLINFRALEVYEVLINNAMPFSKYAIQSRALPDYRDGLKPSQRRVMVTLEESGIRHDKPRIKSLNAEGRMMALHPHGAGYPTMARMARHDTLNIPLLDAKGTMGYHNSRDLNESAPRYTEVRLSSITQEYFKNIKKGIVPFKENYDNSKLEPECLPVSFPSILVNTTIGVAVGFASKICPFPFDEVCINASRVMRGEEAYVMKPDFSCGGYIMDNEEVFKKIHKTGSGTIRQRGKYHIEDGNKIIFTELPYESNVEEIEEKIIELVKDKVLDKEIEDVNNFTDKNGIDLTIELKKNVNVDMLIEKLYALTNLENTFGCNFTMLVDDRPVKLSVQAFLEKWCKFRVGVAKKTLIYDLDKIDSELHLLYGLRAIVNNLKEVIKIIESSETDEEVISALMSKYNLTKIQADYIADRKIRSLNKKTVSEQIQKIMSLEAKSHSFNIMLNDESRIRTILAKQLEELVSKYPYERKSQLIEPVKRIKLEEQIEGYNVQFTLTKEGYFKKVKLTSLRGNTTHRLKDGDEILSERQSSNRADLLIFTSKQNCYKLKANNIEDHKASALGLYLPSHLQLEEGEYVVDVIPTVDYSEEMLVGFDTGRVVRLPLSAYYTKTNRTRVVKALHTDKVVGMHIINEEKNYVLKTKDNRALIISSKDVPLKASKASQGVIMMTSKREFEVVAFKDVDNIKVATLGRYFAGKSGKGAGVGILLGDEI